MKAVCLRFFRVVCASVVTGLFCCASSDGLVGLQPVWAEAGQGVEASILKDVTGDGVVTYLGFGDSLTYGVGDGSRPGQMSSSLPMTDGSLGYNRRLMQILGIPATNAGVPGEELDGEGIRRLPQVVVSSGADIVGIFEGINDARQQLIADNYQRLIQKAVNMVRALGRTPVLFTQVNPCCDHLLLDGSPDAYSQAVRRVGEANDVAVADIFKAWNLICPPGVECSLLNLPEGLHPNTKGYSVIAQVASAAILGTDIFDAVGAQQFLEATGLPKEQLLGEIEIR